MQNFAKKPIAFSHPLASQVAKIIIRASFQGASNNEWRSLASSLRTESAWAAALLARAINSPRCHARASVPWPDVVPEIRKCAGGQFDPVVVEAFDKMLVRLEAQYRDFARGFVAPPSMVA